MMVNLNKDVLSYIFNELEDDNKTLYSCLLVNKLWCETVIPILWRDPLIKTCKVKNKRLLLNMFLSLLSKESKEILKKSLKIKIPKFKNYLFDYIGFLKYLNLEYLHYLIEETLLLNSIQQNIMKQELYKMLINRCYSLKYLNICQLHILPEFQDLSTKVRNCFVNLRELRCSTENGPLYLFGLAKLCKYLQKLRIDCNKDNPGLIKLIEEQKNLECFIIYINSTLNQNQHLMEKLFEGLVRALSKNFHNLSYFKTYDWSRGVCFPYIILKEFKNLTKLKLWDLNVERLESQLRISLFPKLQVLHLRYLSILTIADIISKTEGNLWKIKLYGIADCNNENSKKLIQSIYQNCPNLKFVTIYLYNDYKEVEQLLKNCQKLEGIVFFTSFGFFELDGNKLLDLLVKFAPPNLHKIKLDNGWKVTKGDLENFLNKWKGYKPILLQTHKKFRDIEIFKKEGIIKDYEYKKIYYVGITSKNIFKW